MMKKKKKRREAGVYLFDSLFNHCLLFFFFFVFFPILFSDVLFSPFGPTGITKAKESQISQHKVKHNTHTHT